MHWFLIPQHVPATKADSVLVRCLPKRNLAALAPCSRLDEYGWGLSLEQKSLGPLIIMLWLMLGLSLVFLIVWWVKKDDVQGAAGFGQYLQGLPAVIFLLAR